jgi:hypothetical protein
MLVALSLKARRRRVQAKSEGTRTSAAVGEPHVAVSEVLAFFIFTAILLNRESEQLRSPCPARRFLGQRSPGGR